MESIDGHGIWDEKNPWRVRQSQLLQGPTHDLDVSVRVKGETVEGWVVQSIGADRISVKKADTATVLELRAPQPGLRRPAPRRTPPSGRDRRER